jgi:hypothetical protein
MKLSGNIQLIFIGNTCIASYTNIIIMVTVVVSPGISVTVNNACFTTRTSNIVQPDGTIARSIVEKGMSTRAENNFERIKKINEIVLCSITVR